MQGSFFARVGLYVAGNTLQRAIAYVVLPIYAWLMPADEYGRYAVFISAMAVVNLLFDMGLSKAASRHYIDYEEDPGRLRRFLDQLMLQRTAMTLVIGPLILAVSLPIWRILTAGSIEWWPFVVLLLIIAAADSFLLIVVLIHRMKNDAIGFTVLKLGQAAGQCVFGIGIVAVLHEGAAGAACGVALGSILSFSAAALVYRFRLLPRSAPDMSIAAPTLWRENIGFGAPLLFYDLAFWLRTQADPFILVRFLGLATVGTYQLGYVSGLIMGLIIVSIDLAYAPLYYRWKRSDDRADMLHRRASTLLTLGTGIIAVWGVLAARPGLLMLLGPKRAIAGNVAPILILTHYVYGHYLAGTRHLFFKKRLRIITIYSISVSLSCIACTFLLIPHYGYIAAAWMNVATFCLLWLGGALIARVIAPPFAVPLTLQLCVSGLVLVLVLGEPRYLGLGARGLTERTALAIAITLALAARARRPARELREMLKTESRPVFAKSIEGAV